MKFCSKQLILPGSCGTEFDPLPPLLHQTISIAAGGPQNGELILLGYQRSSSSMRFHAVVELPNLLKYINW
jgi:hypothetical protein